MFKTRKSRLVIRLPSAITPLLWCLNDHHGNHSEGTLEDLTASDDTQEVWVLVPACHFLFKDITPLRVKRENIEWELEEFSLEEPQDLHITLLSREEKKCNVAALAKSKMVEFLSLLNSKNIVPNFMCPDILALSPYHSVTIGEEWIVRDRFWQGFSIQKRYKELMQRIRQPEAPITDLASSMRALSQGCKRENPNLLHGEFSQQRERSYRQHFLVFLFSAFLAGMVIPPLAEGIVSKLDVVENERLADSLYQEYFGSLPDENTLPALRKATHELGQHMRNSNVFYTLAEDEASFRRFAPFVKKMRWESAKRALTFELNHSEDVSKLPQKSRGVWSLSNNNQTLTVVYKQ